MDSLLPAKQALIPLVTFHLLRLVLKTRQERLRHHLEGGLPNLGKRGDAVRATSTPRLEKGKLSGESQGKTKKKRKTKPQRTPTSCIYFA